MDKVRGIQGSPDGCGVRPTLRREGETVTSTDPLEKAAKYLCITGGNLPVETAGSGQGLHWTCYKSGCIYHQRYGN